MGAREGWRDQNGGIGRVCSAASGTSSSSALVAVQSPYPKDGDFVFPSLKAHGIVPLSASIFVADHLRPAAKKTGVDVEDGQRFGLHNLRHSLSNWLVNKAKVEPKTVQGILRHSRIQTTLDLYTQDDGDETRAAQGEYLTALGVATQMVQRSVGSVVGWGLWDDAR
jgi:integrase